MEETKECVAVYPGTFDPFHMGHVSLVRRGLKVFPTVIVAVANNSSKTPLFSIEERQEMIREIFKDAPGVIVDSFSGLLVDYVHKLGANVILRGLRAVSDFEYEFQMALMNRKLRREIQTMFLMTDYRWMYLSSSIIKEVAEHDGNIKGMVPDSILPRVYSRFAQLKKS